MVETLDESGQRSAYLVKLNEVNAENASFVESFALVAHLYMGSGKTEEHYQGFDAMRLMNTIIERPRFDANLEESAKYEANGYSVRVQTKSGMTRAEARPGFDDKFNLLSLGQSPTADQLRSKSFYV